MQSVQRYQREMALRLSSESEDSLSGSGFGDTRSPNPNSDPSGDWGCSGYIDAPNVRSVRQAGSDKWKKEGLMVDAAERAKPETLLGGT